MRLYWKYLSKNTEFSNIGDLLLLSCLCPASTEKWNPGIIYIDFTGYTGKNCPTFECSSNKEGKHDCNHGINSNYQNSSCHFMQILASLHKSLKIIMMIQINFCSNIRYAIKKND